MNGYGAILYVVRIGEGETSNDAVEVSNVLVGTRRGIIECHDGVIDSCDLGPHPSIGRVHAGM